VQEMVKSVNAVTRVQNACSVFIRPLTVTLIGTSFQPAPSLKGEGSRIRIVTRGRDVKICI
jgi:hypothetical protein